MDLTLDLRTTNATTVNRGDKMPYKVWIVEPKYFRAIQNVI